MIFRLRGWKLHDYMPPEAHNSIVVAAPHTSNWDFVYALSALQKLGVNPRFTIKKELNRFPFGNLITGLGALWIDRSPRQANEPRKPMTQVMADLFKEAKKPLCLLVTAEGTRSKARKWKTGFYFAALEAKVPVCMAFMDYRTRTTGIAQCFMPSGDLEADMRIIMEFYKGKCGKYPEQFVLDERFS